VSKRQIHIDGKAYDYQVGQSVIVFWLDGKRVVVRHEMVTGEYSPDNYIPVTPSQIKKYIQDEMKIVKDYSNKTFEIRAKMKETETMEIVDYWYTTDKELSHLRDGLTILIPRIQRYFPNAKFNVISPPRSKS